MRNCRNYCDWENSERIEILDSHSLYVWLKAEYVFMKAKRTKLNEFVIVI